MNKYQPIIKSFLLMLSILGLSFLLIVFLENFFDTQSLVPMIFVLAVFLTSLTTQGFVWGILASIAGVLIVNFVFTFPYFTFDFTTQETLFSTVVMLWVAVMTSTLTTKIKLHDQIKAETEKEKIRANLLRAISHDVRQPLTSIYGACSALIENQETLSRDQRLKLLREMREDSEGLIRMVENLLSVTQINGGKVAVSKTPVVLEELIDSVLLKFKKRFPNQPVIVDLPAQFISIPMDILLIEQVLINLLENAIHHAEGMTQLSLRVFRLDRQVFFQVADNGSGIPKEKLEKLFVGYPARKDDLAGGNKKNMGIGLTVCDTIIKAHGGCIQAINQKDGGALFQFYLEMETADYE